LGRYLFYVDTSDVGLVPHLALNGCWEAWITLALARAIHPGHRCLDLGANVGYYAVLMADAAGPDGRVRACEPNPRLAGLLRTSLEVNGLDRRVETIDRAVTHRAGDQVVLCHPPAHLINASLFRQDGHEIRAETVTVDELVADWPGVDVVKVDVEGAEELVWRGMLRTLVANPQITVFMEFSNGREYDGRAFLERIQGAGFPLRYVDTDAEIKELPWDRCLEEDVDWVLYLRRT
jgi:FkbM family methyltransferase